MVLAMQTFPKPTRMSPGDLVLLSRLLDEALALSPEQAQAWLGALPPAQQHLAPALRDMLREHQHEGPGAFLATGFAFQLGDRWPMFNAALGRVFPRAKGIRRAGSAALDLAHVACGIFDGFFELGLKPWDIAAGALLVQEAGGVITDWEGGQAWFASGSLVAGTRGVARDLLGCFKG